MRWVFSVCWVFISCCLITLPMADVPLTLGSWTMPVPYLPASNSNSSQGLNRSSPQLTHSLTNQLALPHCTALTRLSRVKVRVTLWLVVYHQSFCLGTKPHETHNQPFFFQLNTCSHRPYVTSSLTREGACLYNCCWPSSVQSFSGPSPAGLLTIFHCLWFETPATWRARSPCLYPQGTWWPSYTPRHSFPISSPPTTCRVTVKIFEPAFTQVPNSTEFGQSGHIVSEQTHRESHLQHLFCCCMMSLHTWCIPLLCVYGPLPSNGSTCCNIFTYIVRDSQ
jgi:hypothetical protein